MVAISLETSFLAITLSVLCWEHLLAVCILTGWDLWGQRLPDLPLLRRGPRQRHEMKTSEVEWDKMKQWGGKAAPGLDPQSRGARDIRKERWPQAKRLPLLLFSSSGTSSSFCSPPLLCSLQPPFPAIQTLAIISPIYMLCFSGI